MIDDLVLGVVSGEVELSGRSVLTYMKPGDRSLLGGGKDIGMQRTTSDEKLGIEHHFSLQ